MKIVTRTILAYSIFATFSVFYISGINSFPDYENYLRIAKGSGFAVSEHDYLFEWLSRFVLGFDGISATKKVEILAVLNQIICVVFFIWIGLKSLPDRVYGALFSFCLFGFLFMTSILRASPAYLSISAFFLRGGRFDLLGLGLLFFSIAWHDSAALVVLICFVAKGLSYCVSYFHIKNVDLSKIFKFIVICSGTIVFSAEALRPFFSDITSIDLGVRAAYFEGDGAYSFSKSIFILFGIFCCFFFVNDTRQSILSRIFILLMSLVVAMFHTVNGILSVRFMFFVFLIILPMRGIFMLEIEKQKEMRIIALMISPLIFYFSVIYVFSNTL